MIHHVEKIIWEIQSDWSQRMFGPDSRGPIGSLRHLEKETREAQQAPGDLTEYADCFLLLLDATRRAGFTYAQLIGAAFAKLLVNVNDRKWPPFDAARPIGTTVEHLKDDGAKP